MICRLDKLCGQSSAGTVPAQRYPPRINRQGPGIAHKIVQRGGTVLLRCGKWEAVACSVADDHHGTAGPPCIVHGLPVKVAGSLEEEASPVKVKETWQVTASILPVDHIVHLSPVPGGECTR